MIPLLKLQYFLLYPVTTGCKGVRCDSTRGNPEEDDDTEQYDDETDKDDDGFLATQKGLSINPP